MSETLNGRKVHPAANIFPMMRGAEFERLKASIEEIGQQEFITLWRGQVVDGRNRLKACEELGLEVSEAELDDDEDPVAYAIAANQSRRNLTNKSQLAMCAAKLAGLKNGSNRFKKVGAQNCAPTEGEQLASEDAAKMFGVSRRSVTSALMVLRDGTKPLIELCENGDVPINLACRLIDKCSNKREQASIAKNGKDAIKEHIAPPATKDKRSEIAIAFSNATARKRLGIIREICEQANEAERNLIRDLMGR